MHLGWQPWMISCRISSRRHTREWSAGRLFTKMSVASMITICLPCSSHLSTSRRSYLLSLLPQLRGNMAEKCPCSWVASASSLVDLWCKQLMADGSSSAVCCWCWWRIRQSATSVLIYTEYFKGGNICDSLFPYICVKWHPKSAEKWSTLASRWRLWSAFFSLISSTLLPWRSMVGVAEESP